MPIHSILIVDDSKTELYVLSQILGKQGYAVRTAENGDEAMRRLEESKPDLILMDVVMPGQNGFQLTRTITRDARFADVPLILCTSKNQETDKLWGLRQGARDYVVKPVNGDELLAKIKRWAEGMGNREALRELQSRLAQRLHGSGEDAHAASWLAFECEQQGVIVPLATAGEIFTLSPLTRLSHTKPWFLGVANLRGQLHGVVDLAAFLGLRAPRAEEELRDVQRLPARLLAFNAALGSHCAVLIDKLEGLRSATQLQRLPPQAAPRPAFAPAEWRDSEGRTWQEIDLGLLARCEQYLAISA